MEGNLNHQIQKVSSELFKHVQVWERLDEMKNMVSMMMENDALYLYII